MMKLVEIYGELGEEYPIGWDIEEFKKLNSFSSRIKYCEEKLQRISSGTSRIVYKIDDEKVLKLAKNAKGLSQNELEITYSQYYDIKDTLGKVYEYSEDNTWVEMELARVLTKPRFREITGFKWDDYVTAMNEIYYSNDTRMNHIYKVSDEIMEKMYEEEFIKEMFYLISNYDIPVGDLIRTSSYGIVKRGDEDTIVLIDYGLNNEIYSSYYS